MTIGPLLPQERLLYEGKANAVIEPDQHGLSGFPFMSLWSPLVMGLIKETSGGKLYVTTARVIFSSHRMNRVRGRVGTPISLIRETAKFREGLAFGVRLDTEAAEQRFVSWSGQKVLSAIGEAQTLARQDPDKAKAMDEALVDQLGGWQIAPGARELSAVANAFLTLTQPPGALDVMSVLYAESLKARRARES